MPEQPELFKQKEELLTLEDAAKWASEYLDKDVTKSNISYLINYGVIKRFGDKTILISKSELQEYYDEYYSTREEDWKEQLGDDLNWKLSFEKLPERETTKHVHRLHTYKGKYIPQLVEYFLNQETDKFKQRVFFQPGDTILDPFCGSGTTLVQANELNMNAIGIDVSEFNAMISNVKITKQDLAQLEKTIKNINQKTQSFLSERKIDQFVKDLQEEMSDFNKEHFPSPEFKRQVRQKLIQEKEYGTEKAELFLKKYLSLVEEYNIQLTPQNAEKNFLTKWYIGNTLAEIDFLKKEIDNIDDDTQKETLRIILSKSVRSCRATTHSDLATLKSPQVNTYYCRKHKKICKPIFTAFDKWKRYSKDTLKRLKEFSKLRTKTFQYCLKGDSRSLDIFSKLETINPEFTKQIKTKKLDGIFCSPPYVGLINYHEQHAYAYDLYGLERNDKEEIGKLTSGKSKQAQQEYIDGIADVLKNCIQFLKPNAKIFLVANDDDNLYPEIAKKTGLQLVNEFKRPVLNRTEKNRTAYAETIFQYQISSDKLLEKSHDYK